jgi:hypothetical protein
VSDDDLFRGVFDGLIWADSSRDPESGRILIPVGPEHTRVRTGDGDIEMGPQIAHRLTWWLTEMRLRSQMTQTELASLLGTTQPAIAKWERGRTLISLARLARWGDVTGIPVALYFDLAGDPRRRAMWL